MASFRGGMEFVGGRPVKLVEPDERLTTSAVWVRCLDRPVVTQGQRVDAGQRLTEPVDPTLPCRMSPFAGTVAAMRTVAGLGGSGTGTSSVVRPEAESDSALEADDGLDALPTEDSSWCTYEIHIEPAEATAATTLSIEPPNRETLVDWYDALRHTGPWTLDGLHIGLVAQFERAKQRPPDQLLCIGADRFPPFADRSSLITSFADDAVLGLKVIGDIVGAKRTTMLVGRTARVVARLRKSCRNFDVQLEALDNVYPNADPTMAAWLFSRGRKRLPHRADPMDHGVMLVTPWSAIRLARWITLRKLDVMQPLMVGRVGDAGSISGDGSGGAGARGPAMRWVWPGQALEVEGAHRSVDSVEGDNPEVRSAVGGARSTIVILGDPMTGQRIESDADNPAIVGPGEQLVSMLGGKIPLFVEGSSETGVRRIAGTEDCIGCGWCTDVCPTRLRPIRLVQMSQTMVDDDRLAKHLPWCIDCGLCSHVCPSHIPLAQMLREAKGQIAGSA